jgi:hypothetical protein
MKPALLFNLLLSSFLRAGNPVITDVFTADPAPLVVGDTVYLKAPWIHKHGEMFYLSYATGFPEKISYSASRKITGPWKPQGLLAEGAFNSNTIHQGIITFKGKDYFFYHNGSVQSPNTGGSFRRSVCIEELHYEADGRLQRVVQTTEGLDIAR